MNTRLRFSILARDHFTCRYCGRKAPDVVLHVDHVHPQVLGGEDHEDNLVTACVDCNLGKGQAPIVPVPYDLSSHRDLWRFYEEEQLSHEWKRYFPLDTKAAWQGHFVRMFLLLIGPEQVRFEVRHAARLASLRQHSSYAAWSIFLGRCRQAIRERQQRENEAEAAGYREAWQSSGIVSSPEPTLPLYLGEAAVRLVEVGR